MGDVAVLGDRIPELAAALELAEVGLRVRVFPSDAEEGAPEAASGDGTPEPDHGGTLRAFVAHIAAPISAPGEIAPAEPPSPGDPLHLRSVTPVAPVLRGPNGTWCVQPDPAVWGIPAVPLSSAALRILGGRAALRATLDRITPVLTIGKTHSFGALVRSRMGATALARLVDPLSREAMGVPADEIDVAIIAPGLNEALTRVGTLSGAAQDIAERTAARETGLVPDGGWKAVREALRARLRLYDVAFAAAPADRVVAAESGWMVSCGGDAPVSVRALVRGVVAAPEVRADDPAAVDSADSADPGEATVRSLLVGAGRVCGIAPVAAPELPAEQSAGPAVCAVRLANGETWSVRLRRAEGADTAGWEARVLGPAMVPGIDAPIPIPSAREQGERIREAIEAAGVALTGPVALAPMPFAPYATVAAREHAEQRLAQWCESQVDEVPTGVAIHGGSLARAVEDARSRAITLRRRLTGIAD